MKYRIEHDRENCIACGSCWSICPEFWEQGEDGKSLLKNNKNNKLVIEEKDLECNKSAAESCPVNVIHIIEEDSENKLI
ncbi:ferredoxin [Candidatus Woesearchaeota archaeon]|nr:MAG: ferredoxin [Candidatus Woesearchaeota archaeon]